MDKTETTLICLRFNIIGDRSKSFKMIWRDLKIGDFWHSNRLDDAGLKHLKLDKDYWVAGGLDSDRT
jgi:hypothetical protein